MTKKRDYQADFYASFAGIRERGGRVNRAAKIEWVFECHIPQDLSGALCLDIGCSAGVITAQLASMFKSMIGVDYDRTALAAVEPDDKVRASFVRTDAMHLPFPDNSVDALICAQVYEHVPDDRALFAEIYRVLRPGGHCFFSGPNWLFPIEPHYFLPFLHWLPEAWADCYLRLMKMGSHYYERSRTLWGLRQLLHQFEITDITVDVLFKFYVTDERKNRRLLKLIPVFGWRMMLPLFPNFNWILRKPKA